MVQRIASDLLGGVDVVLGLLGGHDNLVKGEGVDAQSDLEVGDILCQDHLAVFVNVSQAGNIQGIFSRLDSFKGKASFQVRYGPEVIVVQLDYRSRHRFCALGVEHLAFEFHRSCSLGCRKERKKQGKDQYYPIFPHDGQSIILTNI